MLIDFCKRNNMLVTNTWFKHHKRRIYTWKKPGDSARYQIDYILVKKRFRNGVKNARSYPSADIYSDHNLVMARIEVKLKKLQKRKTCQKTWCLDDIKNKKESFREYTEDQFTVGEAVEMEDRWRYFKNVITTGAKQVIGYKKKRQAKKPWVTKGMIDKMEERRKWKNDKSENSKAMYNKLNNELRRETDEACEKWWNEQCDELEELERIGRTDIMYNKVKLITRTDKKVTNSCTIIKDSRGRELTEKEDIKQRWHEYVEELYCKNDKPNEFAMNLEKEGNVVEERIGLELLDSEILEAINDMKDGKAVGADDIPAEFLKILGEKGREELIKICKDIYNTGIWPEEFLETIMVPLQKKANAVECTEYRTLSLISHASKILLKILAKRIQPKADYTNGKTQFGFKKGVGTRNAIGMLRILCERSLEFDNELFVCFVDFEKAFDRVNWVMMMDVLKKVGVDWKERRLIQNLYMNQIAKIRLEDEYSDSCVIGRGVSTVLYCIPMS